MAKNKSEEIKFLTEKCFSHQDQIKTLEKNWQDRQRAIMRELSNTQTELSDIYKQIALIYLNEKSPRKEPLF